MLKKILPFLMAAGIAITNIVPVMATEPAQVEETKDAMVESQTDEDEEYISDSEYFESEQDRRIEKATGEKEEVEEPDKNVFGGYDTYQEYLDSMAADELTQEQIDEGYTINEYGIVEEPTEGDAYNEIIMGGVNPGPNTGYVTFRMQSDAEIHEEVYLTVINMYTFKMYGCNLYEINDYSTQMCLPAGNYMIQEAGLTLDGVGRFYANTRQFTVEKNSTQILDFVLIDSEASTGDVVENKEDTETAPATEIQPETNTNAPVTTIVVGENEEENKKFSWAALVFALIIIGAIAFIIYKYAPRNKKHEFRGYDD